MARVTYVKKAQQRYRTVPVLNEDGTPKVIPVLGKDGTPKTTKTGRAITRRLTQSDKSQPLPNHKCERCGTEITVGSPYKWIKPKSGPYGGRMRVRCQACPSWRPSETTGSAALSVLYGAQEAADDALGTWDAESGVDALEEILTTLAEGVREAAEVYAESAQNMVDGFGHETAMSDEIQEKADHLEGAADEIESAVDELDEFDEDSARSEAEDEVDREDYEGEGMSDEEVEEAYQEAVDEALDRKREEWAEEQRSKVEDAIGLAEAY